MSSTIRRYVQLKEDFEFTRGFTKLQKQANRMRINFFTNWIVNAHTYLYKTQVERDWAYIALRYSSIIREFRYDVQIPSICHSAVCGLLLNSITMFVKKKFTWVPFFVGMAITYSFFWERLFEKHNKKFFDMCNVGEQYSLGKERNRVLQECNQTLNVQDF